MKLFDNVEAVKFPEENLIFITHNGFLYYFFNPKYSYWRKHRNAGNDSITVRNYPDVSKEELMNAMGGVFPSKTTDFLRLCNPSQINVWDMLSLLDEDYPNYMTEQTINDAVRRLLLESVIHHKSYLMVRKLFDDTIACQNASDQVLRKIKELCFAITGRDIFKKEIGIVDGHDYSSYFWIRPVRIVDYSDSDSLDTVAEMDGVEISIEENDVDQYLTPFLYPYFDKDLEANRWRVDHCYLDEEEKKKKKYYCDFEWYLTHNFYTIEAMRNILRDIGDTMDALSTGRENAYTAKLKEKRGFATYELLYAKDLSEEQIKAYNANRPKEDDTETELIIDFYRRFSYRMEYMIRVGEEKGFNLISFMGP